MDSPKKSASASAAADLTDDLLVDILSRLPAKSICRFKCVSWHWFDIITDPEHRKKIAQTLSGFFYPYHKFTQDDPVRTLPEFVDILGAEEPFADPKLTFMAGYRSIIPKICCNGLLFCLCWKVSPREEADYVVCNPATEKWVVVSEPGDGSIHLAYYFGFDPAISPHFYVFQFTNADEDYGYIGDLNIYSSETGAWSCKGNGWGDELQIVDRGAVFLNGMLHLLSYDFKILAVNTEGKTWKTIHLLEPMTISCFWKGPEGFIGQSQGRLYYINRRTWKTWKTWKTIHLLEPMTFSYFASCWRGPEGFIGQSQGRLYYINMRGSDIKLSVWILEDYDSGEWVFKYSISIAHIFREKDLMFERDYALIVIHPECNMIFFVWRCEDLLISYDMDRGKVRVICDLKKHLYDRPFLPYLPYVPYLSDSLAAQGGEA